MSNSYSVIHNFDNVPLENPDFNLIQNALQYKQTKLDTNRAKVQSVADQFAMLDVAKDVDKEYVDKRLQAVVDMTNQYGASGDLSSSSLANSLMQNINQVADENVKNAVFSTKLYRAEQAEWEKVKKDNPEKYSQLNHAYANRTASSWLNDDTVGKRYNGGAGFIEYRDLSKKLMDNIGKMQDQLKAKWIQTGPGQGYFQSIDTYEAIDRNKMSQALDMLYDEKDKQQMRINSWGEYDQASPERMKAEWEAINAPELDNAQKRIDALKVLKSKPGEQGNIAAYDAEIAQHQNTIKNIQSNNFEDVYNTYGKDGASQILYSAKLKDSILDAYSYEPRLIDRKIDEVQAENVKFQQKVSEFNQTMELKKTDLMLRTEQLKVNKQLAEAKLGIDSNGNPVQTGTTLSEPQTLKYGEGKTGIQEHLGIITKSWEGLEALGVSRGSIDKNDFVKLNTQLQDLEGKAKRGESINIGGKAVKVTLANIVKLRNFRDNVVNTSKAEKEVHATIDSMLYGGEEGGMGIQTTLERLAEAKAKGRAYDFDVAELPKFDWVLEPDGKGGMRTAKAKTSNPYATLLTMKGTGKTLTAAQEATLKAYTAAYSITDKSLDIPDDVRTEMYRNLRYNTLQGVSSAESAKIIGNSIDELGSKVTPKKYGSDVKILPKYKTPLDYSNYNTNTEKLLNSYDVEFKADHWSEATYSDPILHNTIRNINEAYDLLDVSPNNKQALRTIADSKITLSNYKKERSKITTYTPLSSVTAYDTEWNDASGKERSIGGMDAIIEQGIGAINGLASMDKVYKEMSYQNPILQPGNPSYNAVKNLAIQKGLVGEDYKGALEVSRFEKGDLTGKDVIIKASVKKSTKEGGGYEYKSSEPVEYNNFLKTTNFEIARPSRPSYDATKGVYAQSITLGKGAGTEDQYSFGQSFQSIIATAKEKQLTRVPYIISNYMNGNYNFGIEAINNTYYKTVRGTSGEIIYKEPTYTSTFDDEDYVNMVNGSDNIVSDIMTSWLNNEMQKESKQKDIEGLINQNQQIISR